MKFLFAVLSCQKNKYLWNEILKRNENIIIFCGGEPEGKFRYENRVLYLNCDDFYEGLPEKVICMIDAILNIDIFNQFTHLVKIDDYEAFLDYNKVLNLCQMYVNNNDYSGSIINGINKDGTYFKPGTFDVNRKFHFNKCSNNSVWNSKEYSGIYAPYCCSGHIYILSRKSLVCINNVYNFKNKEEVSKNHIYEDLMVGIILNRFDIMPKFVPKMIN